MQERITSRLCNWARWSRINATKQVNDQIHPIVTKTNLAIGFIPCDDEIVRRTHLQWLVTDDVSCWIGWLIALRCRMLPIRLLNDVAAVLDHLK